MRPQFRSHGIGKALIAHVAGIAVKEEYFCIRCEMLGLEQSGHRIIGKLGAVFLDEWKAALLIGDALQAVSEDAK